jgi:hypothetical protein
MKCSAKPGEYCLPTKPTFTLTIRDCQYNVTNVITGSVCWDLYEDIRDTGGVQQAKDAWWEVYLWMREQERLQNEKGQL